MQITRGCVMHLIAEKSVASEDGSVTDHKKSQHRIIDSKDGLTYFTSDESRETEDLKDFPWDDTLTHASNLTLPYTRQP